MSSDYMRFFPKPTCYPNQKEAMESIHKALLDQKIVLFEGACGTGKTLSTLVPAIDVAQKLGKVVIIATNVHQQMQQFIEESREIKQKQDIKVAVLKGKKHMCPREEESETCSVLKENTYELINKEKESADLREQLNKESKFDENSGKSLKPELDKLEKHIRELRDRYCSYLYGVVKSDMDDFSAWYFEDVRTTEEVNEWAYERDMCGYELMKRQMVNADLVICNFHHILNFKILANLLGWMDRSVDDVIMIFDEAHNLESAARSHSSLNLPEYSLQRAFEEVTANEAISKKDSYRVKDLENLFKLIYQHLKDIYESRLEFGERERIPNTWKDVTICDPKRRDDYFLQRLLEQIEEAGITDLYELLEEAAALGRYLDAFYKEQYRQGHSSRKKNSQLLRSAEFFMFYLEHASDLVYYPMLNVRRKDNELEGRIELVSCIPKNVTAPIFSSFYVSVLMSATLQPYPVMKAKLGITRPTIEIAYGITFPEDNRLTIAINSQPLFAKKRDDPGTIQQVTKILNDIIQHTDGNVLVFFQSYHEAKMYKDRITSKEPVYLDEIGISSRQVRDDFFKVGETGNKAIIFSYLWGTLTEGVDYKDGRGRAVVIVGVGYPALNDRMRAIEAAYDHEFPGKGWDYAIQIPTIRKVRQAMGRVIRSPSDYGARILLDGRYTSISTIRLKKYSVFNAFPPRDRDEIIDVEPDNVKFSLMNFFNDMKSHQ
ncbi:MAG: ATP-dependent DNA helicase [Methanosarcinales archaeon]|nr:ATP-dependent DNA helicase [Methanosarcinales archaeon]